LARKKTTKTTEGNSLEQIDKIIEQDGLGQVAWANELEAVERIPTGLLSIDRLLGGGIPKGRMTELFGKESSGKTLLLQAAIAETLRQGGNALLVDTEHTFDPVWAETCGVDVARLRVAQPDTGEAAYEIIERYLKTGQVDIIGLDSLANVVPTVELAGDYTQTNVGLQARLNAKGMRKLTSLMQKYNTALVFINQTRGNIATTGYGPTETTTFAACHRIESLADEAVTTPARRTRTWWRPSPAVPAGTGAAGGGPPPPRGGGGGGPGWWGAGGGGRGRPGAAPPAP
jgi:protein RecA